MDGDFRLDVAEIVKNIETAEIICLYFPLLRKTLLLDTRFDVEDEPMVKIVPMVDTVEERFRTLRRLRPRFPKPESLTVIPWPKYVDSLLRLGIWQKLVQRFIATGHKGAVRSCQETLEELRRLETEEFSRVIKGDSYHTVWQQRQ
ncbi:MAG: hypothetical protein HY684_00100 [Chloroflexi bacterium]|nr:hypothetical protein [Chloroflexota bacterium]